MSRTACLLVALAAVIVTVTPVRPAAQGTSRSRVDELLDRYVSGREPNVIAATFPDHFAFLDWRVELLTRARGWRESWHPAGAAFLLELSFWGSRQGWPDAMLILGIAEDLVTGRGAAPGSDAEQDRFEMTFHRTAVAWLISARRLAEAQDYLQRVETRIESVSRVDSADGPLRDARLALARGVLEEAWTAPGAPASGDRTDGLPTLTAAPQDAALRSRLEHAAMLFESAARRLEVREEALVRRAFSLHRLARNAEAAEALERLDRPLADPVVHYWRHLFLGRVLEALARPREAAAAYRAAADLTPGAQTPAVALAALFQREGQADEARRWARVAGATAVIDPWWHYWSGDLRFVSEWLSMLRGSPR